MTWLMDRLGELDSKAMIPIFVALISLGGTWIAHTRQQADHESGDQRFVMSLTLLGSQRMSIDSLRASNIAMRREIRRLRVAHGKGSRIVAWPDTIIYGPPFRPGRGTLLASLRKLWPW